MAIFRTALLLLVLTGILVGVGMLIGGTYGMFFGLVLAFAINFVTYWWSDKIVLKIYRAKPSENKKLNSIVERLAKDANIPKPSVYVIPTQVPNAFATGRDPKHAAVAATEGLLNVLNDDEIAGVLAHELGHVKNRDTLIATMAATIAGAVSFLARIAWWGSFGSRDRSSPLLLPLLIFAPFGAMLVQLAISRSREFGADYTGAQISKNPLALASALDKISSFSRNHKMSGSPSTAHLWIVNPFSSGAFMKMFSTHPPVEERIKRLKAIKIK